MNSPFDIDCEHLMEFSAAADWSIVCMRYRLRASQLVSVHMLR